MTVADNTSRNQYTATSGQTVFAYTFEIVDKDDIVVLKNGTTLSEGTDYTVSNVGNDNGGNVTLTSGATAGDILTLYRDMPYARTQNYTNSGDFLASEVNSDFDNLWLAGEQTNRSFSQSIRKPITDSDSISMELPEAADRANKYLSFSSTGAVAVQQVTPATDASAVTYTPAGTGAVDTTVQAKLRESVSVKDFGAVGDGTTDDTDAIQAAFDAAAAARDSRAETYVEFASGDVYLVSSTIAVVDVSIKGNGATLLSNTAITIMQVIGNSQVFLDFNLRFASEQSNSNAIGLKLTDGTRQAAKNTYINVIARNCYIGFYNEGSPTAGIVWGSVFKNCRATNCYDWGWYLEANTGATTCHFDTCQARGSTSGSQSKGFYINNIADVVMTNTAVDQVDDGQALEIRTASQVVIDTLALESCEVTTADQHLILLSAVQVADITSVSNKVCTYDVGAGNDTYILKVSAGSEVRVGSIRDVLNTITSGTVYKIRGSNNARIRTQDVALSEVDTLGNFELFFDFGRIKGLANSDPSSSFTGTFEVGDIAINRSPASTESIGWVCVTAGTPGTWKAFGTIAS